MGSLSTDFKNAQLLWDYLRFDYPLRNADVIIGLGSSDIRTAEWCAELYHDGYAPRILFTGGRGRLTRDTFTENEADVYARRAMELRVPEMAILKEDRATNTGENITYAHRLMKEKGINARSLIIVTKPYMLRRAYATFMKQWPSAVKPDVQCSGLDISFEDYCKDEKYPFDYVTNVMVGDLQRIREYPKLGFQIEQEVPESVIGAYDALVARGYTKHLLNEPR